MHISQHNFVVSGGVSGLGQAVVEALARAGARIAVVDIATDNGGDDTLRHYFCDITQEAQVERVFADIAEHWGGVHGLINCAGVAPARKILDREGRLMSALEFSRVLAINTQGSFSMCAHAAALMAKNAPQAETGERGVLINVASAAAYEGQKGQCAYAASKGAVTSMTLPMARDLAPLGIRVMCVAPGVMATPLMQAMPEAVTAELSREVLFPPRLGQPDEFARLVLHIIENSYLNAETIRLDGGLRMR